MKKSELKRIIKEEMEKEERQFAQNRSMNENLRYNIYGEVVVSIKVVTESIDSILEF